MRFECACGTQIGTLIQFNLKQKLIIKVNNINNNIFIIYYVFNTKYIYKCLYVSQ